jgi:hypothetical protein
MISAGLRELKNARDRAGAGQDDAPGAFSISPPLPAGALRERFENEDARGFLDFSLFGSLSR